MGHLILLCLCIFLVISSATAAASACNSCVHQSRVSFFSNSSSLLSGACGYGSMAADFYGGQIAAAAPALFKGGAGCGACFQMICKEGSVCNKQGTTVVVTDLNTSNETDFVMSTRAFTAMAAPGKDQALLKLGILHVDYKRVACDYKGKNLGVRVEETSDKAKNYLTIKFVYQGGQTEIVAVDVAQVGLSSSWEYMSRNHGAIWEASGVPNGALQFRFVVTAGYDGKWYWAKNVLPSDWKNGVIYDSGLQITDIAQDTNCSSCHHHRKLL